MMEQNDKSNYSQFSPKKYPMPICPNIMKLGITLFSDFFNDWDGVHEVGKVKIS